MSVPNQKTVFIRKPNYVSENESFLMVGKQEWIEAYNRLAPASFALYLYLAGNNDGYKLELSQAAVEKEIRISRASYDRAKKELLDKGYLVQTCGNVYEFHTKLKSEQNYKTYDWENSGVSSDNLNNEQIPLKSEEEPIQKRAALTQERGNTYSKANIERRNINIRDNIDKIEKREPSEELRKEFGYLEDQVSCDGFVKYEGIEGYWFDEKFPRFWDLSRDEKQDKIHWKCGFKNAEADYIVDYILDD